MSTRFENPFENLPKEAEKKAVGKKALWESVKPASKLAEIIKQADPEAQPQLSNQMIPDKFGRTVDESRVAETKITAAASFPTDDTLEGAVARSFNPQKMDAISPQPPAPNDEYLKGRMSQDTDEARIKNAKKKDIGKAYV